MAFVLRLWRRPTSGRKVLHLYWLQAPILDASPPQAPVEQPVNRRSGYGGVAWRHRRCEVEAAKIIHKFLIPDSYFLCIFAA